MIFLTIFLFCCSYRLRAATTTSASHPHPLAAPEPPPRHGTASTYLYPPAPPAPPPSHQAASTHPYLPAPPASPPTHRTASTHHYPPVPPAPPAHPPLNRSASTHPHPTAPPAPPLSHQAASSHPRPPARTASTHPHPPAPPAPPPSHREASTHPHPPAPPVPPPSHQEASTHPYPPLPPAPPPSHRSASTHPYPPAPPPPPPSHREASTHPYPQASSKPSPCCNQDKDCVYSGDCCFDTFLDEYSGEHYISYYLQRTEIKKYFKTVPILNTKMNPTHQIAEYYMISACGNISSYYYRLCNYLYSNMDVPVYDKKRLVYRNLACARCHDEKGVFKEVNITVSNCVGMLNYIKNGTIVDVSFKNFTHCIFDIHLKNSYNSLKRSNKWSEFFTSVSAKRCSETEKLLCEHVMSPFYDNHRYRWANSYCANCYRGERFDPGLCSASVYEEWRIYYIHDLALPPPFFFSVIVSRSIETIHYLAQAYKISRRCGDGKVFDALQGKCVYYRCRAGYKKDKGKCTLVREEAIAWSSIRNGTEKIIEDCILQNKGSVVARYPVNVVDKETLDMIANNETQVFVKNSSVFVMKSTKLRSLSFANWSEIILEWKIAPEVVFYSLVRKLTVTYLFGFSPHHHIASGKICKSPTVTEFFNISSDCNININGTKYVPYQNSTFWTEVSQQGVKYFASICGENDFYLHSTCSMKLLKSSLYSINADGTANVSNGINLLLAPNEYLPERNGISVCISEVHGRTSPMEYDFEEVVRDVEYHISLVTLIISIVCESVLFITYVSVKQLRNTPGKIILALSAVLELFDLIVLGMTTGNVEENVCDVLGPLLHLLSVSLYFWTGGLAYDLWKTFRNSFQRRENQKNEFIKLSAFVSAMSVSLVGFPLAVEYGSDFPAAYGMLQGGSCWIKSKDIRFYLYLIPSYAILLATITLLVFIVIGIRNSREPTVSTQKNINLTAMALKLSLMFGVPEVLGIVLHIPGGGESQAIIHHSITMLISVLRSSRGLSMFFIFYLTKNVLKHVKPMLSKLNMERLGFAQTVSESTSSVPTL